MLKFLALYNAPESWGMRRVGRKAVVGKKMRMKSHSHRLGHCETIVVSFAWASSSYQSTPISFSSDRRFSIFLASQEPSHLLGKFTEDLNGSGQRDHSYADCLGTVSATAGDVLNKSYQLCSPFMPCRKCCFHRLLCSQR